VLLVHGDHAVVDHLDPGSALVGVGQDRLPHAFGGETASGLLKYPFEAGD